jgi:hypothetical protein
LIEHKNKIIKHGQSLKITHVGQKFTKKLFFQPKMHVVKNRIPVQKKSGTQQGFSLKIKKKSHMGTRSIV